LPESPGDRHFSITVLINQIDEELMSFRVPALCCERVQAKFGKIKDLVSKAIEGRLLTRVELKFSALVCSY
jgi:hypothetical protein